MDFNYYHSMQVDDKNCTDSFRSYKDLLDANYCPNTRPLLAIRTSSTRHIGTHPVCVPASATLASRKKGTPFQPSLSASCILDAPHLRNDFYLNVMDWGPNGVLAIALHQSVHLYSPETGDIQTIDACTTSRDYVTSVKWAQHASCDTKTCLLAIGTLHSFLQLWDVATLTQLRSLRGHSKRIGSLSWHGHNMLTSGSRDATIQLTDVRCAHYLVHKLVRRQGEICGLAWSPDGKTLASGSCNHELCLWDHSMLQARSGHELAVPRAVSMEHHAPVRALAWSPWQRHLLASGGGTADSTIKLWRASTGTRIHSVPTGTQVCALVWSSTTHHLVSAHGYGAERHELTVWTDSTLERAQTLTGHTARVLHAAISPNGTTLVSAGADETLRFWNVFPSKAPRLRWRAELSTSPVLR